MLIIKWTLAPNFFVIVEDNKVDWPLLVFVGFSCYCFWLENYFSGMITISN